MALRQATIDDLQALIHLEKNSFHATRRMSTKALKNSLLSSFQDVWVWQDDHVLGCAIVFRHASVHRLYSIAVDPKHRGKSIGKQLMLHVLQEAQRAGATKVSLEVEQSNVYLVSYYENFGFKITQALKDYYGTSQDAFRMVCTLQRHDQRQKITAQNLVVTDLELPWLNHLSDIQMVQADAYINDERYKKMPGVKIFNLCASYSYQSLGYYVSLMAAARTHRVMPNVATMNDFSDPLILKSLGEEAHDQLQKTLASNRQSPVDVMSYFGYTPIKKYQKLLRRLYPLFESPFVLYTFEKGLDWRITEVKRIPIVDVMDDPFTEEAATAFFHQKRYARGRLKEYLYDLAILIDPDEKAPPSNALALSKFKAVANKMGFYTEFITQKDYARLGEFDALWIRATTNVNNYTYHFSRYAYAEGLVVIDDPWAILKCSNKLFFTESMNRIGIKTPPTVFVNETTPLETLVHELGFPMILKQPDSAFSLGVFKVLDLDTLKTRLDTLLTTSALVIAQAYIPSSFDWRIGILDGEPLYACHYHMAKGHWQIINWQSKRKRDQEGHVTTVPLEEVPQSVLKSAIKAAKAMGDGLFGVDLKVSQGQVYVIEVNDNPNLDHGYEVLDGQEAIYARIVEVFHQRIRSSRGLSQPTAIKKR